MLNCLTLQGRLVDNPTTGQTNSGTDYANFRIAWNKKFKEKESNLYIDCKAFGGTARLIGQYFVKGQEVVAEGELNTDEWEKDGQKRSKITFVINQIHFCGKKQDGGASNDVPVNMTPVETSDLPF